MNKATVDHAVKSIKEQYDLKVKDRLEKINKLEKQLNNESEEIENLTTINIAGNVT